MSMEISAPVRTQTREELEDVIMDLVVRLYLSSEDSEKLYVAEFEKEQLDMELDMGGSNEGE